MLRYLLNNLTVKSDRWVYDVIVTMPDGKTMSREIEIVNPKTSAELEDGIRTQIESLVKASRGDH